MNYRILFRDTLRLFRESKLLWIFGAFSIVSETVYRISILSIGKHPTICIPYPLALIAIYFLLLSKVGLIYSANQSVLNQTSSFSDAWDFCKGKVKRILGLFFVSIPFVMLTAFIPKLIAFSEVSTSLTLFMEMLVSFFFTSLFTFSICTIVINNLESGMALWTGLLIVFNNFIHVMVLNIIYLILQTLLIWVTGSALFCIFLFVPFTITMMLAYREFTDKTSYPALSHFQTPA
jgi:hypothetical protein